MLLLLKVGRRDRKKKRRRKRRLRKEKGENGRRKRRRKETKWYISREAGHIEREREHTRPRKAEGDRDPSQSTNHT